MDGFSFVTGAVVALLLLLSIILFGVGVYRFVWLNWWLLVNGGLGAWWRYIKGLCGRKTS